MTWTCRDLVTSIKFSTRTATLKISNFRGKKMKPKEGLHVPKLLQALLNEKISENIGMEIFKVCH